MAASHTIYPSSEVMINVDGLEFWTEGFGNNTNPAIILIMGSGGQGVAWPREFCEGLAELGYFVIRFDNRDTGLSSSINFDTHPYTLLDMANDVIRIMDYYQLRNAHIVGASMGGVIAMLLSAHFPGRVRSLTLMVTTTDMRPAFDAFQGIDTQHALPGPDQRVLNAAKSFMNHMPESLEEKIKLYIETSKLNSGSIQPDESLCREIALQVFDRMKNPDGTTNHFRACMTSYDLYAAAPNKITAYTHIIHGSEDPIFPLAHGHALQDAIAGSILFVIPGLGHCFTNRQFFKPAIMNIDSCAKAADAKSK